jgi:hypothetical protein
VAGSESADKNLKEFLERYGEEGFLKLFFTNYLFELVSYYIHNRGENEADDPSFLMHVDDKGVTRTNDDVAKFNESLRKQCLLRAELVIAKLKETGSLKDFISTPISDPRVVSLLDEAFRAIVHLR